MQNYFRVFRFARQSLAMAFFAACLGFGSIALNAADAEAGADDAAKTEETPAPAPAKDDAKTDAPAADAPAEFDWNALGLGQQPAAPQPAWQKKLEEVQPLLQGAYAAQTSGKRDDALANLAKVREILADPEIPARHVGELVYMLGIMYQQLEDYDEAEKLFTRMIDLADAEGMEVFGRDVFRGLGLLQLGEMSHMHQGQPERALDCFDKALALQQLPSEFRSTVLARAFGLRMSSEKLFDVEALSGLVRRELVWSAFEAGRGGNGATDARLPGNMATVLALTGRADEARAILKIIDDERADDPLAGEMSIPVSQAFAALEDAEGAARWLGKDLAGQAMFRNPQDFGRYLDWLEKSHAYRAVKEADAMAALFKEWRGKTAEAVAEKRPTVVPQPMQGLGDIPAFGG